MRHLLAITVITLLAIGTGCEWISPSGQTISSVGIQVHGHWTATVTNPDGILDAVHEALVPEVLSLEHSDFAMLRELLAPTMSVRVLIL